MLCLTCIIGVCNHTLSCLPCLSVSFVFLVLLILVNLLVLPISPISLASFDLHYFLASFTSHVYHILPVWNASLRIHIIITLFHYSFRTTMDLINLVWIAAFVIVSITSNILYLLIFKYIDDKPMGSQSIFDLVMKDHFMFARLTASVYCAFAVLAKVNEMTNMLR